MALNSVWYSFNHLKNVILLPHYYENLLTSVTLVLWPSSIIGLGETPKPRRASEAIARRRSREGLAGNGERREDRPRPIAPRDVLMVTRLDRLARSTRDLLNTLATITAKSAGFRSLHDSWADTTTAHGRLMLTVLGGLAEFERELIRARTGEGRARAVANGVRLGRKPTLTHHQQLDRSSASMRATRRRERLRAPTM
jgi:hypothetical protein